MAELTFEDRNYLQRMLRDRTFTMEGEIGVDTQMYFTDKGFNELLDAVRSLGFAVVKG